MAARWFAKSPGGAAGDPKRMEMQCALILAGWEPLRAPHWVRWWFGALQNRGWL